SSINSASTMRRSSDATRMTNPAVIAKGRPKAAPTDLFIRRAETDRVSVRVRDRDQQSDRTLAVERRHDGDGDFVAGVEGIGSLRVLAEAEPRDRLDAAADDRPLDG